jgi:Allene oxide cyclase barrel like domain
MRKLTLIGVAAVLMLGLAGVASVAAASQTQPSPPTAKTLNLDVAFSPFTAAATNNVRDPNSPISVGDEVVFHDQLLMDGTPVGDDVGSCVIVSPAPELLSNCTIVVRLPDGDISGQFVTSPGPAPKPIALTGGTGTYRNVGGEATLVEFGDDTGTLTLEVVSLAPRHP